MNRKINSTPANRIKTGEQGRRTIMEKHIMGENGIGYTLGEDDLYYPDLYLPEETEYPIGKYGKIVGTNEDMDIDDLFDQFEIDLNRMFGL